MSPVAPTDDRTATLPTVAVFDCELPPALAFIRSLGRAGVPVIACSHVPRPAGRFSRHVAGFRSCPDPHRTDEFHQWLHASMASGEIGLVAPTSDFMAFHLALTAPHHDAARRSLLTHPDQTVTCLFKDRFTRAMTAIGFPVPRTFAPGTVDEALDAASSLDYPVLLKPRSHVGVGIARGQVVHRPEDLATAFRPYAVPPGHDTALRHDADLPLPLLQEYVDATDADVISITGFVDVDGDVCATHVSRKLRAWPPRLGIGTLFESIDDAPPFLDRALDAVRAIAGPGLFELEVLVDRRTGEFWAIDLNPRGFGQITLDIARGNDLPLLWYRAAASVGGDLRLGRGPVRSGPTLWVQGVPLTADAAVRVARGPDRVQALRRYGSSLGRSRVGCSFDRRDPIPGMLFGLRMLRHPGGLVRPFLR